MATATPLTIDSRSQRLATPVSSAEINRLDQAGQRLRVCHISLTLATGGLERILAGLAEHHDRSKFELDFLTIAEGGRFAEEIRRLGCRVEVLNHSAAGKLSRIGLIHQLRQRLRRRYDIVHTHNTYPHLYGTVAARWAGIPIVINTRHGQRLGHGWKSRVLFRSVGHWTDCMVSVSADAARLSLDVDGLSAPKVTQIWNGIDPQAFPLFPPRCQAVGIAVARLSPEKDFSTLLHAVAIARRSIPELTLRIVGDGPQRTELETLARRLQIADGVEFLGECSDVSEQLARAGFFVSSSLSEGISLTLLEAMAAGRPVIATAVGGNVEVIDSERIGKLVPPRSPESLASAIATLCGQQDCWAAMGVAARQRVIEQFDVRRMTADYERLYRQLVVNR